MAKIIQRIVSTGETVTAVQIASEEILRPLVFGGSWRRIRIGMLCAIAGAPENLSGSSFITMGVCNGMANGFSSPTCRMVGGAPMSARTTTIPYTFAYYAGPPAYYAAAGGECFSKILNTVVTAYSGSGGPCVPHVSSGYRGPLYVDLTKAAGTGLWYANCYAPNNAPVDYTSYKMLAEGCATMGLPQSMTLYASATGSVTFDDSSTPLNTLSIYYPNPEWPLEIYAIAVHKHY